MTFSLHQGRKSWYVKIIKNKYSYLMKKKFRRYEIQLSKNKMNFNNRKIKN